MKLLKHFAIVFLGVGFATVNPLAAQDRSSESEPSRATVHAYYGGIPFYTAFHQHMTTRLSILKAS